MSPVPTTFYRAFGALLISMISAIAVIGCASLHPPLDTASSSDDALSLAPLRAEPEGLVFRLHSPAIAPGHSLEIRRRSPGSDWTTVQTIDVDAALIEALRTGDAQWTDQLDDQRRRLEYRLRVIGEQTGARHGDSQTIDWPGWLGAPSPGADVDDQHRAVLYWDHDDRPLEARILRRDVVADTDFRPLAIVDSGAGGRFIDPDVEPGSVYAYRLQFVDRQHPIPHFSDWAGPVYLSIPSDHKGAPSNPGASMSPLSLSPAHIGDHRTLSPTHIGDHRTVMTANRDIASSIWPNILEYPPAGR